MSRKRNNEHTPHMPGLRLTRKPGERVRLMCGDIEIWVAVDESSDNRAKLVFAAPQEVIITREELLS